MQNNYNTYKIIELRENIKQLIQQSELNIGLVYYLFKDIYKDLELAFYQQVNKESLELQQQQKEAQENNDDNNTDQDSAG